MAVIINDFEIISEPPAARRDPASHDSEPAPPPSAPDVERILQTLMERRFRVEAS